MNETVPVSGGRLKISFHIGGMSSAIVFIGCIVYAAYTHTWPWWLVGGAVLSFFVGLSGGDE